MSLPNLRGRVAWVFDEDDFDIDLIVGIRNIKITDVSELAKLAMADRAPDFAGTVQRGDLLVGGRNFGYGHPHYPAMKAMRHLGIAGVVAESFSPGFFRGEISMGFPLVTCPGIVAAAQRGDEIEVDWAAAAVRHLGSGRTLPIEPLAAAERETLEAGGLIPYLKQRLARSKGAPP
ncbi:MAG: 3-isopropylmalate dehydratase [Ideonella sp.]|jgi:3-isopropylmalate/(R)-2-methylmalate dehydratase small subunit|nr:3-isopropylmalate dehydratase [Ideonella sp.]